MKDYIIEEYKSKNSYLYRVRYISGTNTAKTVVQGYHRAVNLVFVLFIRGKVRVDIEGRTFKINEGDMVMMNQSEFFRHNIEDDSFCERIALWVSPNMLKAFPGDCFSAFSVFYKREKGKGNIVSADIVKKNGIDNSFYEILEVMRKNSKTKEPLAICKIIELLCKIGETLENTSHIRADKAVVSPLIDKALNYIGKNFEKDITVQDVADHCGVHRSYLSGEFAKRLGTSLWNYILLRRIHKFNSLMNCESSVEELAYKVGFKNYSNFFRLYKKHMGITPMEFKRKCDKYE